VDADNNILAGWVKVAQSGTAGGVFSPTYAPNIGRDFAALTELGASNGVVAAIELAAAGSLRFENDGTAGWPVATLSAPPAGGTAGTLAIATQATVSPVFPTGTVDLSSTYTFGNGTTVALIANGGTGLVAGQTLTELSGHSPTPHKVVVNTVSAGAATNLSWSDGGGSTGYGYTSYPPSPANFTGGLRLYLPLFTVLAGSSISIVSGGYYASTRPTVSFAPAPYQNTASPTVKMGASWYADAAGAHGTIAADAVAITPAPGDNDTSVATTAFVQQAVATGTAAIVSQTIATVTANTVSVPAGTNYIVVSDSINPVNTLTVGGGTLADGYDLWMSFPNGGNFAGVPVSAHGNLTLKTLGGGWSILAKFG
jgi:hypothetical protein